MTEARRLTDEEFGQISVGELESNRALIRDVHLTIDKSKCDENSTIPGAMIRIEIHTDGKWKSISFRKGFTVVDDDEHVYFFEEGWPCYHDEFLNPEDIIPSGQFTLNASKENRERALKLLRAENATIEAVQIPADEPNEFFQTDGESMEEIQEKINQAKVQIPITSMKRLNWAIYNCNQRVFNILGTKPIMFTKELKRTDGRIVERFNHKANGWEVIPGKPRFPDASVVQKIKNACSALIN